MIESQQRPIPTMESDWMEQSRCAKSRGMGGGGEEEGRERNKHSSLSTSKYYLDVTMKRRREDKDIQLDYSTVPSAFQR